MRAAEVSVVGRAGRGAGDRRQAQSKALGFPTPGGMVDEGQHLQPDDEFDGEASRVNQS